MRANAHEGNRGDGSDNLIPIPAADVCGTLTGGSGERGWKCDVDNPASFIPVAFQQNVRDEVRLMGGDGRIAGALVAQAGVKQQNYIAFGGGNTSGPIEVSTALTTSNQRLDFDHETFLAQSLGVRRLMPVECERLQGFPDSWTEYAAPAPFTWKQPDGTRYRQLGNAVCVNVAEWLGHRIKMYLR